MRTILFVDYSYYGFYRYPAPIIKEIKSMDPNFNLIGIYMEPTDDHADFGFDAYECADKYRYNPKPIIEKYSPDAVLVVGHRFFDYMFTLEAHRQNVPVFNFQHGLYMDSTVVSKLEKGTFSQLLKKKRDKVVIYSKCLYFINEKSINGTASMLMRLVKKHSLYEVINDKYPKKANADFSFIFGEYWKNYYTDQYIESNTDFRVVGYPELEGPLKSSNGLFKNELPSICYLAQTSVEDGAIDEGVLKAFLEVIKSNLGKFNLVLKLHPRSDKSLYQNLLSNSEYVTVWDSPEFPECDCYIGHESTVVARARYITNKTMVYRLSEDRVSPFEQFTDFVCTKQGQFPEMLQRMISASKDVEISKEFQHYVYKNPNGAIKETAEIIIDAMRGV